jgi:sugar phosphate isomerase/epimerase
MKLQLGIVADEIARDFAHAVALGKLLGIARYEVRNLISGRVPMVLAEELRLVEETVSREEIAITAISPGLFKYTEDAAIFAREMREVYPCAAELAHRWQLPGLIVFGFRKPGADEGNAAEFSSAEPPASVVEWLSMAGESAAADGLQLMIEPEPICWADSARAAAALIRRTGSSALRINYDPGNVAWLENRDPLEEFEAAAPLIANVHVKDMRPLTGRGQKPEWVPAGAGMIDYRAHFQALRSAGYQGPVSLEPHMDGSAANILRCIEACEKAWGAP